MNLYQELQKVNRLRLDIAVGITGLRKAGFTQEADRLAPVWREMNRRYDEASAAYDNSRKN